MKKTTIKNKPYESPQLTAVTFKVEEGFSGSDMRSLFTIQTVNDEYEATTFGRTGYGQESVSNQQSWFE